MAPWRRTPGAPCRTTSSSRRPGRREAAALEAAEAAAGPAAEAAVEAVVEAAAVVQAEAAEEAAERARELNLSLDLCLRIGEVLLSSGAGAADVTATMQSVAHHLGLRHPEIDVTFTSLSMSYHRDPAEPPVMMLRNVKHRDIDYEDLTQVDHLVHELLAGHLDLYLARTRMATIMSTGHPWPRWAVTLGWSVMCASVAVFLGGDWLVALIAAASAATIDRLQLVLARRRLPTFYLQVAGGASRRFRGRRWRPPRGRRPVAGRHRQHRHAAGRHRLHGRHPGRPHRLLRHQRGADHRGAARHRGHHRRGQRRAVLRGRGRGRPRPARARPGAGQPRPGRRSSGPRSVRRRSRTRRTPRRGCCSRSRASPGLATLLYSVVDAARLRPDVGGGGRRLHHRPGGVRRRRPVPGAAAGGRGVGHRAAAARPLDLPRALAAGDRRLRARRTASSR